MRRRTAFGAAAREAGRAEGRSTSAGSGAAELSPHLASRQEVGEILRASGVPTIEFRASIVIGSGSASFEMIRALVEKLPVMVTPRWVRVRAQPIAIEDVLAYLLAALEREPDGGELYEIGGADSVTYLELMQEYARQRGLRRTMIPVPVLTPRLSSLWLWLVTPVYAGVGPEARRLAAQRDGRRGRPRARRCSRSARAASATRSPARSRHEDRAIAETRWSDEAFAEQRAVRRRAPRLAARRLPLDRRRGSRPRTAFAPIQRIGGETGWYKGALLWRLRGLLDVLVGGPGLRRGRRDPVGLRVGDTLDFWRVEAFEPDRLLRLQRRDEGARRAWLQFEVAGRRRVGSIVTQTAIFDPSGLFGLVYWYALWPFHGFIFGGMLQQLAAAMPLGATERSDTEHGTRQRHTFALVASRHGGGTQSDRAAGADRGARPGDGEPGRAAGRAARPPPRRRGLGAGRRR